MNVGRGDVNNKRGESPSSLVLSCSKSAKSRRLTYKESRTPEKNIGDETLKFLREMEANNERRERNREKRADERNSILREFLEVFRSEK